MFYQCKQVRQSVYLGVFVFIFLLIQSLSADTVMPTAKQIENALASEGYSNVEVTIEDDAIVVLEGMVDFMHDKYKVYNLTAKFPRIRKISNQVQVNAPDRPDKAVKKDIKQLYKLVSMIENPDKIEVIVNDGMVQLRGKVDYYKTKLMARKIASWVHGVRSILNEIEVEPHETTLNAPDVKMGPITTLVRNLLVNWYPTEDGVIFNADNDGNVTLRGTVSTLWVEQSIVEDIANLAGVYEVVSYLNVE